MDARTITSGLSVSPQITPDDLPDIAAGGFRSVICNRPDAEEAGQPGFAEIAAAAEKAGIEARALPIFPGQITDGEVAEFARLLRDLPGPILAYCRSGTRSATLWALGAAETKPLTDILAAAQAAGYDLSALTPRLASRMTAPRPAAQV